MYEIKEKSAPLVAALEEYLKKGYRSFHMPGHKGNSGYFKNWPESLAENIFSVDLTEVAGLDDLHHPTGVIGAAQELMADLTGAREAFFLVNGVTVGLQAAIMSLLKAGDKIIMPRHAHRCVYEGVILAGGEPIYLQPQVHPRWGIPLGVSLTQVEGALNKYPEAKGLVMVHPTYHGLVSDLEAIGELAGARGVPLIVDEAHGAHFIFSPSFPLSALKCGAKVAVQGWHKTMGSFTQSAVLLSQGELPGLKNYLSMLQSTSPSYLLMASLDVARSQWMDKGHKMAQGVVDLAEDFRRKIHGLPGIACLGEGDISTGIIGGLDISKITLDARELDLNGFQLAEKLRSNYHIEVEMAFLQGVLLMVTMGDNQETMDYLIKAVKDISTKGFLGKKKTSEFWPDFRQIEMALLPKQAMEASKKFMPLDQAVGSISGEFICPYPPGIPLVAPGEIITREVLEIIREIKGQGGHIQGPGDLTGQTIAVIG